MGLEVNYDLRLREMPFGEHEGMDQALHNTVMQALAATPCGRMDHAICPGAETRRQLAQACATSSGI
jgi:probable phosphoglycerate mutase